MCTHGQAEGTRTFLRFRRFDLTEQMRAKGDVQHSESMEAARELASVQPLRDELLARLWAQRITPQCAHSPLTIFAPLATVSNKEAAAYT